MAPRKRNPPATQSSLSFSPTPAAASDAAPADDEVKINPLDLVAAKHACDDAVKKILSEPQHYKPSHLHTDTHLVLGWTACIIAGAASYYGYKVPFEESKNVVAVGVALYALLQTLLTLHSYYIQRNVIFTGRRKTLSGRIETSSLRVRSRTIPASPASPSPSYALVVAHRRTANGGKSLIHSGREESQRAYERLFDAEGRLDWKGLREWVEGVKERVEGGGKAE